MELSYHDIEEEERGEAQEKDPRACFFLFPFPAKVVFFPRIEENFRSLARSRTHHVTEREKVNSEADQYLFDLGEGKLDTPNFQALWYCCLWIEGGKCFFCFTFHGRLSSGIDFMQKI